MLYEINNMKYTELHLRWEKKWKEKYVPWKRVNKKKKYAILLHGNSRP